MSSSAFRARPLAELVSGRRVTSSSHEEHPAATAVQLSPGPPPAHAHQQEYYHQHAHDYTYASPTPQLATWQHAGHEQSISHSPSMQPDTINTQPPFDPQSQPVMHPQSTALFSQREEFANTQSSALTARDNDIDAVAVPDWLTQNDHEVANRQHNNASQDASYVFVQDNANSMHSSRPQFPHTQHQHLADAHRFPNIDETSSKSQAATYERPGALTDGHLHHAAPARTQAVVPEERRNQLIEKARALYSARSNLGLSVTKKEVYIDDNTTRNFFHVNLQLQRALHVQDDQLAQIEVVLLHLEHRLQELTLGQAETEPSMNASATVRLLTQERELLLQRLTAAHKELNRLLGFVGQLQIEKKFADRAANDSTASTLMSTADAQPQHLVLRVQELEAEIERNNRNHSVREKELVDEKEMLTSSLRTMVDELASQLSATMQQLHHMRLETG